MNIKQLTLIASLIFFALVTGCSPKVTLSKSFQNEDLQQFALLPSEYPGHMRDERVAYVESSLRSLLKTKGYTLLSDDIVKSYCSDKQCMDKLAASQGVDGFFVLDIEEISRNDFGLGFYNTIAGTLELKKSNGEVLLTSKYRESERGGLVFDSGQVIQGIKEQVENSGDDAFNTLANKFSTELVNALPTQYVREDSPRSGVKLEKADVHRVRPHVYEICAHGNPNVSSYALFDRRETELRETARGKYCGIVRLPKGFKVASIELRSPYGEIAREVLPIGGVPLCEVQDMVSPPLPKEGVFLSQSELSQCKLREFALYEGKNEEGATLRKVLSKRTVQPNLGGIRFKDDSRYRGVVYFSDGTASKPIVINENSVKEG